MRAAANFFAQLMHECAHIGALGACDTELPKGLRIAAELETVDMDQPRLPFYLDPLARELVEGHAILLQCGNHRWRLKVVPYERARHLVKFFHSQWRHGQGGNQLAIRVMTLG